MSSRRNYLTSLDTLKEYANITINDEDEAWDQISQAEAIIDAFVGWQDRFIERKYQGEITSVNGTTVIDSGSGNSMDVTNDFFMGCEIEMVSGAAKGQIRPITSSTKLSKSITIGSAFSPVAAAGDMFVIRQIGKFPRDCDVVSSRDGTRYAKYVPDAVVQAVCAQVEYMINMGSTYFASGSLQMRAEKIGNYAYEKGSTSEPTQSDAVKLVAPKARTLLRGIKNRTGRLVPTRDSWL